MSYDDSDSAMMTTRQFRCTCPQCRASRIKAAGADVFVPAHNPKDPHGWKARWAAATEQLDIVMGRRRPQKPARIMPSVRRLLPALGRGLLRLSVVGTICSVLAILASQGHHVLVLVCCCWLVGFLLGRR